MYTLWIFNGEWQAFAQFPCENYAEEVSARALKKRAAAKTDAEKNAVTVLETFVCGAVYYPKHYAKTLLRALRHFDEVGISNEIYEALENALNENFIFVALASERDALTAYTAGDTALRI